MDSVDSVNYFVLVLKISDKQAGLSFVKLMVNLDCLLEMT